MSGGSGSGGASGGGAPVNKTALLLFAAGLTAVIAIMGPRILPDDDEPTPTPVPSVSAIAGGTAKPATTRSSSQPTAARSTAAAGPTADDLRGDADNAILTILAFGLPARVSAAAKDSTISIRERVREVCLPDIYPAPCITDYVAKKGTVLTITAGDSRSGYWPGLDYVKGGGCNLKGNGADLKCEITLTGDVEVEAMYYGGENPGLQRYQFPKCPTQRGNNPPSWTSRCQ